MADKDPDTGIVITLASDRGQLAHVKLDDRMRKRCPQLGIIPPEL